MDQLACAKCGGAMTPQNARRRPELFLHDSCLPADLRGSVTDEQAAPRPGFGDCWLLVMRDMEDRRQHGIQKYGTPVQAFNGRDPLIDLYQELLDACVYCRQAIEERSGRQVP